MLNVNELKLKPNPDLVKERANGNVNIEKLKAFFGQLLFASADRHKHMFKLSEYIFK